MARHHTAVVGGLEAQSARRHEAAMDVRNLACCLPVTRILIVWFLGRWHMVKFDKQDLRAYNQFVLDGKLSRETLVDPVTSYCR